MSDAIIQRFAEACGLRQPLALRVQLSESEVLAEGTIDSPFCLIGRDDACDVTLTDAEVDPRHAWAQVVDGRVFLVDLGSRGGIRWPQGVQHYGWWEAGQAVQIGPFYLILRVPPDNEPPALPQGNLLQSDASIAERFPATVLEFRNGRRARDRWRVNRRITLVGRAVDCKIRLTASDIPSYYCGLVLTPQGLWVVDLSGRGVVVNGERLRVSPLPDGSDLWLGRFRIGVDVGASALRALAAMGESPRSQPSGVGSPVSPLVPPAPALPMPGTPAVPPTTAGDDEVPLGAETSGDPSGLSSSHIMTNVLLPEAAAFSDVSGSISIANTGTLQSPFARVGSLSGGAETVPFPPSNDAAGGHPLAMVVQELCQWYQVMASLLEQSCDVLLRLSVQLQQQGQRGELQEDIGALQRIRAGLQQVRQQYHRLAAETPREIGWPPPRTPAPPPAATAATDALTDTQTDRVPLSADVPRPAES